MDKIIISCGIYLLNKDNQLLVGHPTGFNESIWTIPKGRMEKEEVDYYLTAKRELHEETSIDLSDLKIIKIQELDIIRYKSTNKYLKGFIVKINDNIDRSRIKCTSMVYRNGVASFPEFDKFKWINLTEAKLMLHTFQSLNIDKCISFINK